MVRREILAAAGLTGLAALAAGSAQAAEAPVARGRLLRVWSDDAGQSHLQELKIPAKAAPLPPMAVRILSEGPEGGEPESWHNPPARCFVVNLTGAIDCEVTDGSTSHVPVGGLVFLEDMTGKGHITKPRSPLSLLFLTVPDDFDVVKWVNTPG